MDKNGHGTRIAGIVGGHRRPGFFFSAEGAGCGEEFTGGKTQVLVRKKNGKTIGPVWVNYNDLTGTSLE